MARVEKWKQLRTHYNDIKIKHHLWTSDVLKQIDCKHGMGAKHFY